MTLQGNLFDAPVGQNANRSDAILFGADSTERIVAVETGENTLQMWRRLENDLVERTQEPFQPWILLQTPLAYLNIEPRELDGDGYRFLYHFPSWSAWQDARYRLRNDHVEHLTYPSGVKQALILSGKTLFKNLTMASVRRMQIDIETVSLSSEGENGKILLIAIHDNRDMLELLTGDERTMLGDLVEIVRRTDPDIIEGHNILGFDLPFLLARSRRCGMRLAFGRDGSEVRLGQERSFAMGGISRPFAPAYIHGRHVCDTYLAVQRFDAARGELASYGLKEAARAFGIAEPNRVELPRGEMSRLIREDPEMVRLYASQDVKETRRLAELVLATEFYQTQMVPDAYGTSAVTGSGEKINSIFIRAYLGAGCAIPGPQNPRPYPGGYTEIRKTGVLERVVKADVESLYPSIMLSRRIKPASDHLDVFLPALQELTRRRLDAKGRVRDAKGTEKHYWDGLQSSFKVLINSFYGYLGAASFSFNDYHAAESITEEGRRIALQIAGDIEASGGQVIEIDTDGVYFIPPDSVQEEESERAYVASIGARLPEGIRLAFDGRYRAMVSLKTKNYVLYGYDGKKTARGASLRSRADEEIGREFLGKVMDLLIQRQWKEIGTLYRETISAILEHRVPMAKLARRERITEKTYTSSSKQRSASVAGNTAIGEYIDVYERKDGTLGLLTEYQNDENTVYYMEKLYKFASRLKEAFEGQFDELIPKPTPTGLPTSIQVSLDLF